MSRLSMTYQASRYYFTATSLTEAPQAEKGPLAKEIDWFGDSEKIFAFRFWIFAFRFWDWLSFFRFSLLDFRFWISAFHFSISDYVTVVFFSILVFDFRLFNFKKNSELSSQFLISIIQFVTFYKYLFTWVYSVSFSKITHPVA